ncbi:MAG: FliM/FliN family flagellar motor C-terminal domain-containing protein [Phycisphaerae bacterium]|nr:FliM/FliN family flagellar motor switch protein [Phycisphaerales bacterium]
MSILEQDEIDSLMDSVNSAHEIPSDPEPTFRRREVQIDLSKLSPELRKLFHLQVPIIVHLAERTMPMREVLELGAGSIIEFSRSSDAELDLVVGNRHIGKGQAVKVGENFGLRITEIGPLEARIRAMGS